MDGYKTCSFTPPFALSLSKGLAETQGFDKLSPNGRLVKRTGPSANGGAGCAPRTQIPM